MIPPLQPVRPTQSSIHSLRGLVVSAFVAVFVLPLLLNAAPPGWWAERGVTAPIKPANDYATANQGQVKFIAKQAMQEMDEHLPGGAGDAVHNMVAAWGTPSASTNDFALINLGQLKNIAKPFYDQLVTIGYTNVYPWVGHESQANDFAVANIGQVKNLFSFDFTAVTAANDNNHDGMADWWENYHFGTLNVDPAGDPDLDGVSNLLEFQQGTNPFHAGVLPVIFGTTSAIATWNTPFSYQISATNAPTSYGAIGLPAGLSINTASGFISGIPTEVGTSYVSLIATNAAGSGTQVLSLTIVAPPSITSALSATAYVGAAFTYQITTNHPANSFAATGLPDGMSCDGETGNISGTPTQAGICHVILSAANATGTNTVTLILSVESIIAAPTNLRCFGQADGSVQMQWQDNSDNEDNFIIQRMSAFGDWQQVGMVGANVTAYTDTTVALNDNWTYRIVAANAQASVPGQPVSKGPGGTVAIVEPGNGQLITAHGRLSITAAVTVDPTLVSKVTFLDGTIVVGEESAPPYSIVWQNVPVGTHQISAMVRTDSGVNAASDPVVLSATASPAIFAGGKQSFLQQTDGTIWAWGDNGTGQLGTGVNTLFYSSAIQLGATAGTRSVDSSVGHTLFVAADGSVSASGSNAEGQLGDVNLSSHSVPQVPGLANVTAVAAGASASLALKSDGSVWTWGDGNAVPRKIDSLDGVITIAAGDKHFLALTADHRVWAWGDNASGQLGTGDTLRRDTPSQVPGLNNVLAIAAGTAQSVALNADGSVSAWGSNQYGQLAAGDAYASLVPENVVALSGIVAVATKGTHTLALTAGGAVYAFGNNASGQLGDGTTVNRHQPVHVSDLPIIVQIAAGSSHSLALAQDGQVFVWGDDASGQLGNGGTQDQSTSNPTAIVYSTGGTTRSTNGNLAPNPGGGGTGPKIDANPGDPPYLYGAFNTETLHGNGSDTLEGECDATKVTVNWQCPTMNGSSLTGFFVQRRINTGPWEQIASLGPTAVIYEDSNLLASQTYYYRVIAGYGSSVSQPSNVADYEVPLLRGWAIKSTSINYSMPGIRPYIVTPDYYASRSGSAVQYLTSTSTMGTSREYNYPDGFFSNDHQNGYSIFRIKPKYDPTNWIDYDEISQGAYSSSHASSSGPSTSEVDVEGTDGKWSPNQPDWNSSGPYDPVISATEIGSVKNTSLDHGSYSERYHKTLSEPYSADQFIHDAIAGGWRAYPTDWWIGTNGSEIASGSWYSYQFYASKGLYKILTNPSIGKLVNWGEMFVPYEGVEHHAYLSKNQTMFVSGERSSRTFELDPTPPYKNDLASSIDGFYDLQLMPELAVERGGRDPVADSFILPSTATSMSGGIVYPNKETALILLGAGGALYYDPYYLFEGFGVPDCYTYTLSWTDANFVVSVYDSTNPGVHKQISSGYTFPTGAYPKIFVKAGDGIGDGTQIKFTLTFADSGGVFLGKSEVKLTYSAPNNGIASVEDASGAAHRKIALNGKPMPDEKPQHEAETDEKREETFIDALTLGLRHSTTDVYLPVPGSDLTISARRDAASDVWNQTSGLRLHERPDRPFGASWTSNLCANVHCVYKSHNEESSVIDPDYAYVTDENGSVYTFVITYSGDGTNYLPMPTAKHEEQTYLVSFDGSTFKHKFGSTLQFGGTTMAFQLNANRVQGTIETETHSFAALTSITDRTGNQLTYEYDPQATTLVPKTITAVGRPDLKMYIRQNDNGLITNIWDANGNETIYSYDYNIQYNAWTLAAVTNADHKSTKYGYDFALEDDTTPHSVDTAPTPQYHCDLSQIASPNNAAKGQAYQFTYDFDHTKSNYRQDASIPFNGYYVQDGLPRCVKRVDLPGISTPVTFDNQSLVKLRLTNGQASMEGQRKSVITDATGFSYAYRFEDAAVYALANLNKLAQSAQTSSDHNYPCIVYYQSATIDYGAYGSEKFTFDVNAGLAVSSATDLCGQKTTFEHADVFTPSVGYSNLFPQFFNNKYTDPTKQTITGNTPGSASYIKQFTYSARRLLESVTDEEGRKTVYGFDESNGNRLSETIYGPNSTTQPVQSTTFVYDDMFKGFVARRTVHKLGLTQNASLHPGDVDPADWGGDLVTQYIPDDCGRIQKQIVDPDGKHLVTQYTYDHNGNKKTETDPRGNSTTFDYGPCNRLIRVTYPDTFYKRFVYDDDGNKQEEWDENNHAMLFAYDDLNRLASQTRDMNGNDLVDPGVDLITSYTYNNVGSRLTATDPKGNVTTTHYDDLQRPTDTYYPQNIIPHTHYDYDLTKNCGGNVFDSSSFKPTRITDSAGYVTNVSYDILYRPTVTSRQYQLSPPLFADTTTTYDNVGNPRFKTDARQHTTETRYDALNRPYCVVYPDQTTSLATYTSTGLKWQTQDECLQVTETHYDNAGRATDVYAPAVYDADAGQTAHPHTQTVYDDSGNIVAVYSARQFSGNTNTVDPTRFRWDYTPDSRNRRTDEYGPAVTDAVTGATSRPHVHTDYDHVGNKHAVTDARQNTTLYDYDAANRPTTVTSPGVPLDGDLTHLVTSRTTTAYDLNGNVGSVTDANTHTTTNFYDALNRLVVSANPLNEAVRYQYDALGNRTQVWAGLRWTGTASGVPQLVAGGNAQTTLLAYDGLNRQTSLAYAGALPTLFTYDGVVKLTRTDARGQVTKYDDADSYDARDRLRHVRYPGSPQENRAYTYDLAGRLLSVTDGHGTPTAAAYTYDALGRTQSETSAGLTHTYQYDLAGNRLVTQYGAPGGGSGRLLTSEYDGLNRLARLRDGSQTTTYGYDLSGNVLAKGLPDGETETTAYDALGRKSESSDAQFGGGVVCSYDYGYDAAGNLRHMAEYKAGLPTRTVGMEYYDNDRLKKELVYAGINAHAPPTASTTYTYDEMGNRTTRQVEGGVLTTYIYNAKGQLESFSDTGGTSVGFGYDGNGNRATRTQGGVTDLYGYDCENRLVSLDKAGVHYAYAYDYRTRRVERTEGSSATAVVFSGGTSIAEYADGTGTAGGTVAAAPSVEFVRGSDWGGGVGGILYSVRAGSGGGGGSTSYDHYDGRGDVATQTNGAGTITYQANYEAWGTRTAEYGQDLDRQRANTKEEDPTGLLDEGMRYRDLATGVFLTRDPAGMVDGPNVYAYVHQNPWTMFDPEGLSTLALQEVAVGGTLNLAGYPLDLKSQAKALGMDYSKTTDSSFNDMRKAVQSNEKGDIFVYNGHGGNIAGKPSIATTGAPPAGQNSVEYETPGFLGPSKTKGTAYTIDQLAEDITKTKGVPAIVAIGGCEVSAHDIKSVTDAGVSVAIASGGTGDAAWGKRQMTTIFDALAAGKTVDQALAAGNTLVAKENSEQGKLPENYREYYSASYADGVDKNSTMKDIRAHNEQINRDRQTTKPTEKSDADKKGGS